MLPEAWTCVFDLAWAVIALPLLGAAWLGVRLLGAAPLPLGDFRPGDAAERPVGRLAQRVSGLALLIMLLLDALSLLYGAPGQRTGGVWLASDGLEVRYSLVLDGLSLSVATLVALVGWLSLRFSVHYLHREAGFGRFFLLMLLFLSGMQLLVLSGDALWSFIAWEWLGITSFLLIGYAWQRPQATGFALLAVITNRIGDAGFMLGLALSAWWFQGFEWPALAAYGTLSSIDARLLVIGFVLAAMVKSAQLPFSAWLGRALEGPTPSSALFYGSLMVHAGVYLLLRLEPVLVQAPDVLHGLALAGALTAVYAWLLAMVQSDIKSALVQATLFQVSLMFLAIGLGAFQWAAWHLGLHAAWRIGQFLLSPSWLQSGGAPPRPAPRWLAGRQGLYTAVLQRFWLDKLAEVLLLKPTLAIAQDTRQFDAQIIDHALGRPGQGKVAEADLPLVRGDGLAGRALLWLSRHCQELEAHLSLRGRGGIGERLLMQAGSYLRTVELLLEQPRYLMLSVMATFVVIL